MDLAEIKKHYYAEPFRPLEIVLRDGRHIRVMRKLGMGFGPSGRTVSGFDHEDRGFQCWITDVADVRPLAHESADK